jgi:hypothetical protein
MKAYVFLQFYLLVTIVKVSLKFFPFKPRVVGISKVFKLPKLSKDLLNGVNHVCCATCSFFHSSARV